MLQGFSAERKKCQCQCQCQWGHFRSTDKGDLRSPFAIRGGRGSGVSVLTEFVAASRLTEVKGGSEVPYLYKEGNAGRLTYVCPLTLTLALATSFKFRRSGRVD
jgi:hypothetical protein